MSERLHAEDITVPGYRIISEIAKGGMSTVLLALRLDDNTNVVLKVIPLTGGEDPLALKMFMREFDLISKLDHPNVVKIFERAFAENFAYIAMEYFPRGDLKERMEKEIDSSTALFYLQQMALGLEAMHDSNIIHRDIKPGNFLFKEDDTLTIADFGVAKDFTDLRQELTKDNVLVGTPYYMSPEQGDGQKNDKRSDLYSLGVIFYTMLTGNKPFQAKSVSELIYAHMFEPIPKLSKKLSKFQPLVDGLMQKNPDERFQNVGELLLGINWCNKRSIANTATVNP